MAQGEEHVAIEPDPPGPSPPPLPSFLCRAASRESALCAMAVPPSRADGDGSATAMASSGPRRRLDHGNGVGWTTATTMVSTGSAAAPQVGIEDN